MPMMFGFYQRRREMLEAEARRFAEEAPPFGAFRAWAVGDFARATVTATSELRIVLVQETDEPFHRRADFWVAHLRPRVGTTYLVYTPEEADELGEIDPLLIEATERGEPLVG